MLFSIGWGQPKYTCCSPPITLVENVDNNIQNEYYIKTLFFFADGQWPWWHRSWRRWHHLTDTCLDDDLNNKNVVQCEDNTVMQVLLMQVDHMLTGMRWAKSVFLCGELHHWLDDQCRLIHLYSFLQETFKWLISPINNEQSTCNSHMVTVQRNTAVKAGLYIFNVFIFKSPWFVTVFLRFSPKQIKGLWRFLCDHDALQHVCHFILFLCDGVQLWLQLMLLFAWYHCGMDHNGSWFITWIILFVSATLLCCK